MKKVDQLHSICQETTGTLFKLSVEANSKFWTLYIYRSKILFRGTFEIVIDCAINEFLHFRVPPFEKCHKNYSKKFRYLKKPDGKNYNLKNPSPHDKVMTNKIDDAVKTASVKKDSYTQKLEFSVSLGYQNFTECFNALGKIEFENQFKKWQFN